MIDAWTLVDPDQRQRAATRRCPAEDCRHAMLPVQDHCPECGTTWEPPPPPPPRRLPGESLWERPAFLASMTVIGSVTVVPVATAIVIGIAGVIAAIF